MTIICLNERVTGEQNVDTGQSSLFRTFPDTRRSSGGTKDEYRGVVGSHDPCSNDNVFHFVAASFKLLNYDNKEKLNKDVPGLTPNVLLGLQFT